MTAIVRTFIDPPVIVYDICILQQGNQESSGDI
jgi:hypothetical protein